MKHSIFPINYLKSIWTPKKAFENRQQLSWLQNVLVFIGLSLLLVIPVYIHYQNVDVFSISDFYPELPELIDEETVNVLQQTEFSNGNLQAPETNYLKDTDQGIIAVGITQEELPEIEEGESLLLFGPEYLVAGDNKGSVERINYSNNFSLSQAGDKAEMLLELSRQYTEQNRSSIVFTFTIIIYLFILVAFIFIVFVYAYLLTLLKDFSLSEIASYKEAVNLVLNLLGIPTLVAFVYSLYRFNLTTMLAIQIIGLIVMLFILYKQTKFQDELDELTAT